jgi:hypothetical protein
VIGKFILKAVIGPFVSTVAAKAGEAVGDVLAYHINPPEPETEAAPEAAEVAGDPNVCTTCGKLFTADTRDGSILCWCSSEDER